MALLSCQVVPLPLGQPSRIFSKKRQPRSMANLVVTGWERPALDTTLRWYTTASPDHTRATQYPSAAQGRSRQCDWTLVSYRYGSQWFSTGGIGVDEMVQSAARLLLPRRAEMPSVCLSAQRYMEDRVSFFMWSLSVMLELLRIL